MNARRPSPQGSADAAVSEVIGFILMFALSAMILVFTLEAFDVTRTQTERANTGVQLEALADRISSRVVQAGLVSERHPNVTFQVEAKLPDTVEGLGYRVQGTNSTIYVNTTNGQVTANSTTFETEALDDVWVHGEVYSGPWDLEVRYQKMPDRATATKDILLRQG